MASVSCINGNANAKVLPLWMHSQRTQQQGLRALGTNHQRPIGNGPDKPSSASRTTSDKPATAVLPSRSR